jgi:ABC-2 type transport system ATP-binding protein
MDEPLNGLDPKSARILKDLLRELARSGCGIVFSTHILEVAENICDRVGIMYQGRLIAEGSVDRLRRVIATSDANLEEIFFRFTGEHDFTGIISALKGVL